MIGIPKNRCLFPAVETREFYVRRKKKVNSIETGPTSIAQLFLEVIKRTAVHHTFLIIDDKISSLQPYLYTYNFVR